jgi:hypothetical protein
VSKKSVGCTWFCVSALLIVLPVIRSVNIPAGNYVYQTPSTISEGHPMPPPHRPGLALIAEGDPMPPPHRPCCQLLTEGDPMPPPHRPGLSV